MSKYEVRFEFYGKYLSTKVEAETEYKAIEAIKNRINIIEIKQVINEPENELNENDMFKHLWNICNGKKNN